MSTLNKYNYNYQFGLDWLTPITKAVLDCILSYADENGVAFPSQKTIADKLNISVRTVQRHINIIKEIKIADDKPFMLVRKGRSKEGKFLHNIYMFPWLKYSKDYMRKHQKWIIDKLIEEWYEMYIEEIQNQHTHATMKRTIDKRQKTYFSIYYIQKVVIKLSKILNISTHKVIETLINVGYRLSNKEVIYHLDKYLLSAFRKAKITQSAEEVLKKIYQSLGLTGTDIHCIDWQSYANDLLAI